ncbi:hypothetical protein ACFWP5_50425 [Streptomyces sp. NPDC058469]|uniref:hypothetical protein n=1 Tax=Streptomyces sp. NPDC058469 TaxID=3346514 RepID=UPI003653023E
MGVEAGAQAARSRALAVLRIRSRALAVALLPAAVAVILLAGGSTGHLVGRGWDLSRWIMGVAAVVVLLAAGAIALVVARSRPAVSPTVAIAEESAPDLYRMVRDLADRLDVPAPSAIALTPDCDSWLEDRTHPSHGPPPKENRDEITGVRGLTPGRSRRTAASPVLVIGSPFLWWMRVGELRAVLAPVVAGTGPSAHPDIAAARRFVRGLDAAVAVTSAPRGPLFRSVLAGVGWVARLLLRSCRGHAAEMERGVAAAAAERAQAVDYGLRIVAQEQVGLAYAGWDRLLTRVALPAWRMGRWPSRLDAGVVAALTELSRRDRLAAEGFASRLGERPACDLLEEPGTIDEATSLLAARLFHGGPAEAGPDWAPVSWQEYPEEVVDRKWRTDAARLHRVLDTLGVRRAPDPTPPHHDAPTLARVVDHLTDPTTAAGDRYGETDGRTDDRYAETDAADVADVADPYATDATISGRSTELQAPAPHPEPKPEPKPELELELELELESDPHPEPDPHAHPHPEPEPYKAMAADDEEELGEGGSPHSAALAAGLTAELAREEAATPPTSSAPPGQGPDTGLWDDAALPLFPLQPPRTGRELLADHVTAMVCCAAMDTAGALPGLDWLDGPTLLVNGERAADLAPRVLSLVEDGDPAPLRAWLIDLGIRPEKPVRLV